MKGKQCSLKPLVGYDQLRSGMDWDQQFLSNAPLEVEIGFGLGEILTKKAFNHPERNFIGIEQIWERIYKTLRRLDREKSLLSLDDVNNVRILKVDARVAFERFFQQESIEKIYCLFPCPWPKKGHVHNRLFSNQFLKLLNSRLKNNGVLEIVTDFDPYFQWILEQVEATGFKVTTRTVESRYDTKFERKWREQGQSEFFEIVLSKEQHINVLPLEDVIMKAYTIDKFNANNFSFSDIKGETTILFKELLFDERQDKALVKTLVCEKNLNQNFWVAITKRDEKWRVNMEEGQTFFATPAIAKTLELVYQAAKETDQ